MKKLSGLDASFLSLETPAAPMTIGSVSILDPKTDSGRLDVQRFRAVLRKRLDRTPALRRRLTSAPLDLSRPYWVDLPADEVDLEYHVQRTELPEPGGWHELSELLAWEISWPLSRDRPLWQLLFVDGVETVAGAPAGSVAVIARVHHAAIDGVSGAEILGALTDVPGDDGSRTAPPEHTPGVADGREPGRLDVLARTGRDLARMPAMVFRTLGESAMGLAGGAADRARRRREGSGDDLQPPLPFTAPRTSLNRRVERPRAWAPAFLDLARIKAVRRALDATVNDVVLAVCAGALRRWLLDRSALPEEPLVAMVPISVRSESERGSGGNLVSAMLVSLATDEPEPVIRLEKIRNAARSSKVAHQAIGARTLVESAGLVPFALSGLGVRLYSRLHLAERHRPPFNLVITNVPGPARPVSIAGASMLTYAPAAPLFDGLGLILPVFSYAGTVSIGVTVDRALMPDAAAFADLLAESFEELERGLLR